MILFFSDSQRAADEIARLVTVEYADVRKPILKLEEAIEKERFHVGNPPQNIIGNTEGWYQPWLEVPRLCIFNIWSFYCRRSHFFKDVGVMFFSFIFAELLNAFLIFFQTDRARKLSLIPLLFNSRLLRSEKWKEFFALKDIA